MIGKKYINIDWRNFVQGMTSTNKTEDGGFSIGLNGNNNSSVNHSVCNPYTNPGKLAFSALTTDKSAGLTGEIIASCEDTTGNYARLMVSADTDTDGRFWTVPATGTLTQRGSEDTSPVYSAGRTDIISFDGEAYITNGSQVRQWALPATFDGSGGYPFTLSDSYAYHPMIVFENELYIGDGNILLHVTGAGVTPATILTLATQYTIQALGVDPASGKMLISTQDQYDHFNTYNVQGRVHYYNGYSNKVDKVVLVTEPITAFYNMGGTVFTAYGENFGYWTGTGIQFLRRFDIGTTLYKHSITHIMDIMYIALSKRIIAYGEIMKGQGRSWWFPYQNTLSAGSLNAITYVTRLYNDIISFSCTTSKQYTLDTSVSNTIDSDEDNTQWWSKEYSFPYAVTFNSVTIEYDADVTAATDIGTLYITDDKGTEHTLGTINTTTLGKTGRIFDLPNPSIVSRSLQIRYLAKVNTPIERFTIFYNEKE